MGFVPSEAQNFKFWPASIGHRRVSHLRKELDAKQEACLETVLSKLSRRLQAESCLNSVLVLPSLCHTTLLTSLPGSSVPDEQGTSKQLFLLGTIGYCIDAPMYLEYFVSQ